MHPQDKNVEGVTTVKQSTIIDISVIMIEKRSVILCTRLLRMFSLAASVFKGLYTGTMVANHQETHAWEKNFIVHL
jgi:hypothetical protein